MVAAEGSLESQQSKIYVRFFSYFVNIGCDAEHSSVCSCLAKPGVCRYRDAVFGHGSFETFNSTHAQWSWIRNNNTEFGTPGVWIDVRPCSQHANAHAMGMLQERRGCDCCHRNGRGHGGDGFVPICDRGSWYRSERTLITYFVQRVALLYDFALGVKVCIIITRHKCALLTALVHCVKSRRSSVDCQGAGPTCRRRACARRC